MAIYEITADRIQPLDLTSFNLAGVRERGDLQRLLRSQIEVIAPDTLVIAEEFGNWEDSRRRIDLLAIDRQANLVVIELKRSDDGGHMDLQAIRYAAMISTMTFEQVVSHFASHLRKIGSSADARAEILAFLDWDEPVIERFAQRVRIVLAAADFSVELTTAVMWLNEQDIDIRCVKMAPYRDGSRVLIDVQQVIPLPEAADYVVKIKEKESSERVATRERSKRGDIFKSFWTSLKLRSATKTDMFKGIEPLTKRSFGGRHNSPGMTFNYHINVDGTPRVDCYIFGTRIGRPKVMYDQLLSERSEIERRFGQPLGWERLDDGMYCRVRFDLPDLSVTDVDDWAEIQDRLIDTMIRFEKALRPSIAKLEV